MPDAADDLAARLAVPPVPVRLVFFTQSFGCDACLAARSVVNEIASLSDQVTVEEYNFILEKEEVALFDIELVPALAVVGERDQGIRFYGVPSGHERASIVDAIILAATGEAGISADSQAVAESVDRPVDIKVFVTPNCAFCPQIVRIAYGLAACSDQITTSVIQATEYPDLVQRYQVTGAPKTIVDNQVEILGVQPEDDFVRQVLRIGG